jgi:manganese/iron transport system substrate-binding protein
MGAPLLPCSVVKRKLLTTHDAFQYYAKAYGLISTQEQSSAQTVMKSLSDSIQRKCDET